MVFSKVGPNQSIEWGQIRVSKSMIDKKRERNAQKDVQDSDKEVHSAVGRYGAHRRHGIFLSYFEQVPKSRRPSV